VGKGTTARGDRQVAALPVRRSAGRIEVLLVTTLDTGRWVIPKGWPWPGVPDHEAAAGEAREEAGVEGIAFVEPVGRFIYGKRRKDGSAPEVRVDVYQLQVTRELRSWPEKKRRKRVWLTPGEAAERVQEEGLKDLLRAMGSGSTIGGTSGGSDGGR